MAPKIRFEFPDIPDEAWRAYKAHEHNAKRRGIPFLFTPRQWWDWWNIAGRWENRGRKTGQYVMARKDDIGPYSIDNVFCATAFGNIDSIPFKTRSAGIKKAYASGAKSAEHLKIRGDGHPKSRAILTPKGRFGSAALAAEAFGLTRQHAAKKARLGHDGWSYE